MDTEKIKRVFIATLTIGESECYIISSHATREGARKRIFEEIATGKFPLDDWKKTPGSNTWSRRDMSYSYLPWKLED